MEEESICDKPKPSLLPCSAIVYRALRKNWINPDTGMVDPSAYLLREVEKEEGLSVSIATLCSVSQCAKKLNRSIGVASLHVGKICDIGLDVIPNHHDHALIKGLYYEKDNLKEAERLAGLLAKQSRIVWKK